MKKGISLLMAVVFLFILSLNTVALNVEDGFEEDEINHPFVDVSEDMWSYQEILYCYDKGIMTGTSSNTFSPYVLLTRAMAVTALYKMNSCPDVTYDAGFPDVEEGSWYEMAVNWAAEKGLVNGVDGVNFAPDRNITRAEFVTLLYRYEKTLRGDTTKGSLSGFVDASSVADWAKEGLEWAVYAELIKGAPAEGGLAINPSGQADRQSTAVLMTRFVLFNA